MSTNQATGTSMSAILIIVALVVLASLFLITAFPSARESFNEVLNIQSDVFKDDAQIEIEDEAKFANEIAAKFKKILDTEKLDCVDRLDLDGFKDKGVGLEIDDKLLSVIVRNGAGVYNFNLQKSIFFMERGVEMNQPLSITDDLEKINGRIELQKFVYFTEEGIYFLDDITASDLRGTFSPVFFKPFCEDITEGEAEEVKKLKLIATENDSKEIQEAFSKSISDIIFHLWNIHAFGDFNEIRRELNDIYWDRLEEEITGYYDSSFSGESCWRYIIDLDLENLAKPRVSSKSGDLWGDYVPVAGEFTRLKVEVKEDEPRDPRKIAEITLLISTSEECRKV